MPVQTLKYASTVSSTVQNVSRIEENDDSKALAEYPQSFIVELTNLTGNIASINSVQYQLGANCTAGGAVAIFTIEILDGSNSQYFSEFEAIGVGTSEETETGTVRATDGSSAWTESTVNAIRLKGTLTATSATTNLEIDYVHLLVDYEAGAPTAGLIKLNSGLVTLNSGIIKIQGT